MRPRPWALVSVLQYVENLTDPQAAEAVRARMVDRELPGVGSGSCDVSGAELHADPRPNGAGGLRYCVFPRALARATHDDQVAVAEQEAPAAPAAAGTQQQRPR